jgi:catechol 2,3-dioxygenase-like lactoylglutathione lyase family enzyme
MNDTTATPGVPPIECEQHHATLSVSDVRTAVEFYTTKLGFRSAFMEGDPPSFAGGPRELEARSS